MRGTTSRFRSILILIVATICPAAGIAWADEIFYSKPELRPDDTFDSTKPIEAIDLFSGGLMIRYVDYHLPGPNGLDLDIVRWHSSKLRVSNPDCSLGQIEMTNL